MSTTEVTTATTLADLSVLISYASWRGFVLHSLVIVAVYRCAVCDRSRDSAMVATKESSQEVICPKCFMHLVRTDQRGLATVRG
jgi:DNA-directed RNA polymerase subunit RPC12/RpoP